MTSDIDEFYVLRAESADGLPAGDDRAATAFVAADGSLGPLKDALQFPSLETAEAYLAEHQGHDHRWLIQLCTRASTTESTADGGLQRLIEHIMDIPPPYRRTAYNWLRGKNVETLLRRQGDAVYQRHRKALAEHDIDITRPSTVILMRPKRTRIAINTGRDHERPGPRQYVALPAQRPSAAPVLNDGEPTEED